jgi:hypothetical protein
MTSMIQPVAHSDQEQAPQDRGVSGGVASGTDQATTPVDDRGLGLVLFVVFVSAVLFMTGVVAFLALSAAWWVLGLVYGIDLLVTSVVGTLVYTVLGDGKRRQKADSRQQLSRGSRPQSRAKSELGARSAPGEAVKRTRTSSNQARAIHPWRRDDPLLRTVTAVIHRAHAPGSPTSTVDQR